MPGYPHRRPWGAIARHAGDVGYSDRRPLVAVTRYAPDMSSPIADPYLDAYRRQHTMVPCGCPAVPAAQAVRRCLCRATGHPVSTLETVSGPFQVVPCRLLAPAQGRRTDQFLPSQTPTGDLGG